MAIDFSIVMSKVILPAIIAPLTAGIIAFTVTKIAYVITRRYDSKPDGRDGFRVGSDLHVVARGARPRHERRAEDDGRHHARADHRRLADRRDRPADRG